MVEQPSPMPSLPPPDKEQPTVKEVLEWAVPLARLAVEQHRLERLRCGHNDITGTYKNGQTWAGIHQYEVDQIERAQDLLAALRHPPSSEPGVREAIEVLQKWLDETPRYEGDDPRATHYRKNVRALETALAALNSPASVGVRESLQFLCDRLAEFEQVLTDDEVATEFYGHVAPARAQALAVLSAPASAGAREQDLELALQLALKWLAEHEPGISGVPGDSRAVSNEFVAMAAIHARCNDRPEECREIIRAALSASPPPEQETAPLPNDRELVEQIAAMKEDLRSECRKRVDAEIAVYMLLKKVRGEAPAEGAVEFAEKVLENINEESALSAGLEGWRPIETAPKDETDVLLYFPLEGLSDTHPKIVIGWWRQNDHWPETSGWVFQNRAVRAYSDAYQPTHWRPLPAPPSTDPDQGGE